MQRAHRATVALVAGCALLVAACGGGGGASTASGGGTGGTPSTPATPASVFTKPAQVALTQADVEGAIARAVAEAQARNLPAVIAVTDRVGNVLAVFTMTGAAATATTRPGTGGVNTDAQGVAFPAALGAISKAITGAYLSSGGNAFSTRTASMIVQQHFPPSANTVGLESGPLFGVQFSQLPCSDFNTRFASGGGSMALTGPKRAPLGLAADPGGFPLYKNGVVVGGVGIMADGDYGFDPEVTDVDTDAEEYIALAATVGLDAPVAIRADRISVDGTTLRYTDTDPANLKTDPAVAPAFSTLNGPAGALTPVGGFYGGGTIGGSAYGSEASGIRNATLTEVNHPDAFIMTDGNGMNRFPPRAGTDAAEVGQALSEAEVRALLEEAFKIMARARAQIRQPLDSRAQVSISVVDTRGVALGVVRAPDAPIFGIDVSLQKARTAAFFSGRFAAADLLAATRADSSADPNVRNFVAATNAFFGSSDFLTGKFGVSDRAIGNLSRPFFPDGEVARPNGPLSRPIANFSAFSTGLQSALIVQNLVQVLGGGNPTQCTFLPNAAGTMKNRLANGIQIFPGSVPVYRNGTLVGAVGVSGDGIDQDDMISFLGTVNGGLRVGGIGLPAAAIRSDTIVVPLAGSSGVRLRFVNCPFAPFVDTSEQNVCQTL